jgi:hypothetical protein
MDVTETFTFVYDPSAGFSVTASDVNIDFNSCQGLGKNNDLSAYVARLETEGKVTLAQKNELKNHLVESNNCPSAIERSLASKGIARGFNDNAYEETYTFPPTDTNQFTHGLCVLGASSAGAFSDTDFDLEYRVVPDFRDGVKLWSDRDYVAEGIIGADMCEGGIYLEPSRHKVCSDSVLYIYYCRLYHLCFSLLCHVIFIILGYQSLHRNYDWGQLHRWRIYHHVCFIIYLRKDGKLG